TSGLDESLGQVAPAGSTFFYNTPAYAKLKPVLEAASGQALDAITRDWLTAERAITPAGSGAGSLSGAPPATARPEVASAGVSPAKVVPAAVRE
ncbi:MAG: hypothetical protein ACK4ZN_06480, partial [Oceanibaculum sp.]